jgi:ATP-dependent protease HslVU (ClpYQ) ATPase subunit
MGYLPKTLMFIGPTGCGKHTIARYVAEQFKLDFVEIEESIPEEEPIPEEENKIEVKSELQIQSVPQFERDLGEPKETIYL